MTEAAAATALPPEPVRTDVLLRQTMAELQATRATVEQAIDKRGQLPEFMAALARLADMQGDLRQVAMQQTLAEIEAATQPAPEAEPVRHSHRAQRPAGQPRALKAVRGVLPAGGLVAALRHSWVTHPVATAATGFTAATLVIGGGAAAVHVATSPGAGTSSTPNPAASVVAAVPMLQPVTPSPSWFPAAVTKPGADTASSAPLEFPPAVSPAQGPGDPQGGSASQVQVPQVTLVVSHALNLGAGSSGEVRLTAFGGATGWTATTSVAGMMLDSASGSLKAGGTAVITVSLTADLQALAGSGTITITYGDGKAVGVPVSWLAVPLPSLPDPVPSAVASIVPGVLGS